MSKKETKDIYDNYNALSVGDQPAANAHPEMASET